MTKVQIILVAACAAGALSFAPSYPTPARLIQSSRLQSTPEPIDAEIESETTTPTELTPEEEEKVGNLVADEEWAGLSMELADVVRTAVVEDLKKNSRDFLGKDEYLVGDFSKEIDKRVKEEVAKMRDKDDYEVCRSFNQNGFILFMNILCSYLMSNTNIFCSWVIYQSCWMTR